MKLVPKSAYRCLTRHRDPNFVILSSIDRGSKMNVGRTTLLKSAPGLSWDIIWERTTVYQRCSSSVIGFSISRVIFDEYRPLPSSPSTTMNGVSGIWAFSDVSNDIPVSSPPAPSALDSSAEPAEAFCQPRIQTVNFLAHEISTTKGPYTLFSDMRRCPCPRGILMVCLLDRCGSLSYISIGRKDHKYPPLPGW